MEKIAVNPERLMWCCQTFGIDIPELSEHVHISIKTLQAAMKNEAVISINQLKKLADYFNRTMLFFINPNNVEEDKILSPQFRTMNDKKPIHSPKVRILIEHVERQRKIYLGLMEDLDENIHPAWYPYNLQLDNKNIKETANNIRKWLELRPNANFNELREAVETKGIMVIVTNPFNGKWQIPKQNPVRGFSQYYDQMPIIVIKKQSKGAQAFTLIHELVHLLLHKNSIIDYEEDFSFNRGQEKEANEIAGNILIPTEYLNQIDVEELLSLQIQEYDNYLNEYSNKWCVSNEAILVRLVKEDLIDYYFYEEYKKYRVAILMQKESEVEKKTIPRTYRFREPINIFGLPFVSTVLDAFHNKHITLAKTSTYLDNLKIKDVHRLVEYIV